MVQVDSKSYKNNGLIGELDINKLVQLGNNKMFISVVENSQSRFLYRDILKKSEKSESYLRNNFYMIFY